MNLISALCCFFPLALAAFVLLRVLSHKNAWINYYPKNCRCKNISGEQYRKELGRDAFINGLLSPTIQWLQENRALDLKTAFNHANAIDTAPRNSGLWSTTDGCCYRNTRTTCDDCRMNNLLLKPLAHPF